MRVICCAKFQIKILNPLKLDIKKVITIISGAVATNQQNKQKIITQFLIILNMFAKV